MSTYVMAACWPIQIPPTPKAVLISLADNANDHGYCWPSIATISARTCFGKTAVIEAIRWLEDHGLVVAERDNGRHTKYQIKPNGMTPELFDQAGNPSASRTSPAGEPVRQANQSGRRTSTAGGIDPSASRTGPVREADTNRQEPTKNQEKHAQRSALRFNEFWSVYPKRVAKEPCRQKWKAKGLDALADRILDDVRRRLAEDGRWAEGFIPDPLTYITQQRWEDDIFPLAPDVGSTAAAPPASPAPAPKRDHRQNTESWLQNALAFIDHRYRVGGFDDCEDPAAARDRAIAEARADARARPPVEDPVDA